MTTNTAEFQLRGLADPRLAVHATSSLPAWLWSIDGTQILWANPVGIQLFDAPSAAVLAARGFGPANPHRRQIMQLAGRLPPNGGIRLERLRGFGAPLGGLMTCGCARLDFSDGSAGVLVAAAQPSGRVMPLMERLQRLIEGVDTPMAAFARDGMFVGANDAAHALHGFHNLRSAPDLEAARGEALRHGRVEMSIGIGSVVLQRLGAGADVGLVALIEPTSQPAAEPPAPATTAVASPGHAMDAARLDDEARATADEGFANENLAEEGSADEGSAEEGFADESLAEQGLAEQGLAEFALVNEFAEPPAEVAETDMFEIDGPLVDISEADVAPTDLPEVDIPESEPSPLIEAVADEPPVSAPQASSGAQPPETEAQAEPDSTTISLSSGDLPQPRQHPLRFMWQIDADGRFSLGSDEFVRLIGAHTAAAFGRRWSEIAPALGLDPEGHVDRAVATRDTWSGVTLSWPVDGGSRLPVELSALPVYDSERNFIGYRGFGVCRDLDGLNRLASLRHRECLDEASASRSPVPLPRPQAPQSLSADIACHAGGLAESQAAQAVVPQPIVREPSPPSEPDLPVDTPKNVLPFRPMNEAKSPALTPVENNAFDELARQLEARLEAERGAQARRPDPIASELPDGGAERASAPSRVEPNAGPPEWLSPPEPPARGMLRDKALLDLLPVGVLIYRLDRLVYANRAFLDRIGYSSLQWLEDAGGLDALFVEPVDFKASSTSGAGTAVTIAASTPASAGDDQLPPTDARLFTITWDGESALALICTNAPAEPTAVVAALAAPLPAGHADAEDLGAILDALGDGVVMFDAQGSLNCCNRSAEALFGYAGDELTRRNLAELIAPESQRMVREYLESIKSAGAAGPFDQGRDVLGRSRGGGVVPLSMTLGRTRPNGANFFAVFRDLSQVRKDQSELLLARRQSERSANAKADILARISHQVRTPLNAIIGFAEVMIDQRFGALGNERYAEYLKDIRTSGERVAAILDDLLELSRIETGKIDLAFANQNLNELVESCVAVMHPRANRARIIIRTSLAHTLPTVVADARTLRQITLNLIGNSIHLANTGGQVIVSTALSDFGEVVLRVRDSGHGLNDNELAAAMEPFRAEGPADQSDGSGVNLSLTKALVEANRAQFQIKTAPHAGTLIEVVFPRAVARG